MTHHPVTVLPDGTRKYSNYTTYTPIPEDQRKYGRRKPDVEGAERRGGVWFLPLELLPEEARVLPETVPDEIAYDHMSVSFTCRCNVCRRPEAKWWQRKWRRDYGLTVGKVKPSKLRLFQS